MRYKTKLIVSLVVALTLGMFFPGQSLASAYQRYVLTGPVGQKIFVFATPGSPGLDLILRDAFGNGTVPYLILRIPSPFPGAVEPSSGTTSRPLLPPAPRPVPEPGPLPRPEPQPSPQPPSGQKDGPQTGAERDVALTAEEKLMIELVNKERVKAGLKPLSVDLRLVELARKKSQDMIANGYFGHNSPTYGSPFDMMKKAGIEYHTAGENLAGAATVERAHEALMASEGHRRNILNPTFTHIGVGVVKGGPYGMMFTQMFIGL